METRQLSKLPVLPGMKKYGDKTSLCTRVVVMYMIFFSIILSMQWLVDSWAWSNTWGFTYAADDSLGWAWSRILGLVFSTVIMIFEILYLTQDTSTSTAQGDVFRLLFALFIGWGLTSIAVEVSWFAPDIEKSIVAEEKAAIDKMVQTANMTEEKRRDQLLAAAKNELGGNAVMEATKVQEDLDRYVTERKRQRDTMVAEVDKMRSEARTEAAGKISGHYGNGPAAQMMAAQAEQVAARIPGFDAETAREVERLTTLRDTKHKGGQEALQARLDQIRTDYESAINRIAKLSETTPGRDELAAKYGGGSWQASRGALHRFSKMVEMTDAPWTPAWYVKWLCRCIMLVFTIIIIGGKRFAPQDWKQYCNRGQQSRAGHPEARNAITLEGFDPDTYGLNPKIRQRLEQHLTARRTLVEAHYHLDRKVCELVQPDLNGICRTIEQIRDVLHRDWLDNGEICRMNVLICEEAMKCDGIGVPAWPAALGGGVDLLYNMDPWFISREQLSRNFAWVDPVSSIDERKRLATTYQVSQTNLRNLLIKQAGELEATIKADPRVPIMVLWRQRQRWLEQTILPLLEKMENQERRLRQLGGEVPAWPHYFPDPRAEILTRFDNINEYELRPLGWIGPEESGTV